MINAKVRQYVKAVFECPKNEMIDYNLINHVVTVNYDIILIIGNRLIFTLENLLYNKIHNVQRTETVVEIIDERRNPVSCFTISEFQELYEDDNNLLNLSTLTDCANITKAMSYIKDLPKFIETVEGLAIRDSKYFNAYKEYKKK